MVSIASNNGGKQALGSVLSNWVVLTEKDFTREEIELLQQEESRRLFIEAALEKRVNCLLLEEKGR